jgi:predicted MFS family arabinose efflux permease
MAAALRPLRIPAFPRLAIANLVNELGNWLGEIALAILVFDQTGSPLATAALFVGIHFVPALATPPLVSRVEYLPARSSLSLLYATEAAVFAALALFANDFLLGAVLVLAAIDGALASSARALTRAAAAGALRPAGLLREGNAILNIGFTAGAALGPAIAGVVVAGAGVQVALLADACSFLAVAALLASARALPRAEPEAAGVAERLRNGLRYVREHPLLRRLLGAQALAFVFFAVVIPIEVVFAKQTLDVGDAGYGALLASWGVGMVVGSLAFAALGRASLPALLAVSTLAIGCAYLATSVAPNLAVACAASAVGGIGNGVQWVALITAVQAVTATAYQARVVAMLEAIASAMPGVGFVIGGVVAASLDPRASYAVAGAGVLAVLAVALFMLRGADWTLTGGEPSAGTNVVDQALEPKGGLETAVGPHRPAGPADTLISS